MALFTFGEPWVLIKYSTICSFLYKSINMFIEYGYFSNADFVA